MTSRNNHKEGPRFLADQMLAGTARRLRLLGYDCEQVQPGEETGPRLIQRARHQQRMLLTCAHALAELDPEGVSLLPLEDPDEQVRQVIQRWPLPFRDTAFTRCSLCNTPVREVPFDRVKDQLPEKVREHQPPVRECPRCGHLYWEGTHIQSLRRQFAESLHLEEFRDPPQDGA